MSSQIHMQSIICLVYYHLHLSINHLKLGHTNLFPLPHHIVRNGKRPNLNFDLMPLKQLEFPCVEILYQLNYNTCPPYMNSIFIG